MNQVSKGQFWPELSSLVSLTAKISISVTLQSRRNKITNSLNNWSYTGKLIFYWKTCRKDCDFFRITPTETHKLFIYLLLLSIFWILSGLEETSTSGSRLLKLKTWVCLPNILQSESDRWPRFCQPNTHESLIRRVIWGRVCWAEFTEEDISLWWRDICLFRVSTGVTQSVI